MTVTKLISIAEVKKHRHKDSVWTIIHGDVYDVTSFLEEHPGGEDTLLEVAGLDGTQGFEDVGHSDDARELLKKYKIGTLPPGEQNIAPWSLSQCSLCSASSCPHLPKAEKKDKTWRTYDGSPSSYSVPVKSDYKQPSTPRPEGRVQSITVPKETREFRERQRRRSRGLPCEGPPSNLKWALIALAGALVLGIVLKKYLGK